MSKNIVLICKWSLWVFCIIVIKYYVDWNSSLKYIPALSPKHFAEQMPTRLVIFSLLHLDYYENLFYWLCLCFSTEISKCDLSLIVHTYIHSFHWSWCWRCGTCLKSTLYFKYIRNTACLFYHIDLVINIPWNFRYN
jgi:hypothetical protein